MTHISPHLPSARRSLGDSPLMVSPLAWGMWRFHGDDLDGATALVETAIEIGVNLFDTAARGEPLP